MKYLWLTTKRFKANVFMLMYADRYSMRRGISAVCGSAKNNQKTALAYFTMARYKKTHEMKWKCCLFFNKKDFCLEHAVHESMHCALALVDHRRRKRVRLNRHLTTHAAEERACIEAGIIAEKIMDKKCWKDNARDGNK